MLFIGTQFSILYTSMYSIFLCVQFDVECFRVSPVNLYFLTIQQHYAVIDTHNQQVIDPESCKSTGFGNAGAGGGGEAKLTPEQQYGLAAPTFNDPAHAY